MAESERKRQKRIDAFNTKVRNDLKTAFMGKGKRGFAQWLKLGRFLSPIPNDEYRYYHNDRCEVIGALIGEENIDKLLDKLCDDIVEMAGAEEE